MRIAHAPLGCLTLLVALWPSAVHAQLTAPREAAQILMGPLSVYPTLRIVDAGKDRNVFNDEENPKEDFTFTVASRALAVLKIGVNEVMFSTGNDYVWFRDFAEERSSNTRYAGRANLSAGAFKPFVGFDRQHTRSRPNPEIDARALRLDRSVVAGFSFSTADRTAMTASVMADDSAYADGQVYRGSDLGDALNRVGRSMSAGVRYKITPLTSVAINANYGEDTFPDSHIRDAKSYSVVPTLEFSPDAAIRGRFGIGVEKFQPLDVTLPASLGAVYDANLNWSLFGRTNFDLTGSRDTRYSYQDSQPYYLVTGARLNVAQHLFGPLDLLGGADWEHLAYGWHRGVAPDPSLDSTNTVTDLSAGIGVNMGRSFRLTVTADQTQRRSPRNPRQNFRRTRMLSSVTIGS
jgi:putative beta-barrel porin BBP2